MSLAHLDKMNDLLRQQLGFDPLYRWILGGTLQRPMALTDEDGMPQYDPVQTPLGVWVMQPRVVAFRYDDIYEGSRPDLPRGWFSQSYVLCCRQRCLLSPAQWEEMYGSRIPYVEEDWVPVSMPNCPVVVGGPPHALPTLVLTEAIIKVVKQHQEMKERLKSSTQYKLNAMDQRNQEIKKRRQQGEDYGRDLALFGSFHLPGKKDMVSLPSVTLKPKGSQ